MLRRVSAPQGIRRPQNVKGFHHRPGFVAHEDARQSRTPQFDYQEVF